MPTAVKSRLREIVSEVRSDLPRKTKQITLRDDLEAACQNSSRRQSAAIQSATAQRIARDVANP